MNRTWGKLSLPLADTNATDFSSLDPARDILLELFAASLIAELTPRWADATLGTVLALNGPVAHKEPFEPEPEFLQQTGTRFPLLCVYRDSEPQKEDEFTLWQNRITSKWGVDYFLGPLDVGRRGKLTDVLTAVGKILASVVREGGHSSYATTTLPSGATQRKLVFGADCGFSTIQITDFRAGPAQFTEKGPKYWACTATLETTELDTPTTVFPDFTGSQATLGTGTDAGIITNLLVVNTDSEDTIWP